jgi:hypothetical protein
VLFEEISSQVCSSSGIILYYIFEIRLVRGDDDKERIDYV